MRYIIKQFTAQQLSIHSDLNVSTTVHSICQNWPTRLVHTIHKWNLSLFERMISWIIQNGTFWEKCVILSQLKSVAYKLSFKLERCVYKTIELVRQFWQMENALSIGTYFLLKKSAKSVIFPASWFALLWSKVHFLSNPFVDHVWSREGFVLGVGLWVAAIIQSQWQKYNP